jgi:hypothetical protein
VPIHKVGGAIAYSQQIETCLVAHAPLQYSFEKAEMTIVEEEPCLT